MSRCAIPRRAVPLLFGRMRRRLAVVALVTLVPGCASMRPVPPRQTAPVQPAVTAAIRPLPTPPPVPELHQLANRHIDAWEHRLRAEPSLRQAIEESLTRGAPYLPRICAIL